MHNDALPFTLVGSFVIFCSRPFYAVASAGVREKCQSSRWSASAWYSSTGSTSSASGRTNPAHGAHHRLIPGIVPTIRHLLGRGLPIDAQILVRAVNPPPRLASSPLPDGDPVRLAPHRSASRSFPPDVVLTGHHAVCAGRGPANRFRHEGGIRDARPTRAGQQPNRGTSDEHSQFSASSAGPLPTSSVSPVGDGPLLQQLTQARHTRRHRYEGASPARWCRATRGARRSGASRPHHAPRDMVGFAAPSTLRCSHPVRDIGRDGQSERQPSHYPRPLATR